MLSAEPCRFSAQEDADGHQRVALDSLADQVPEILQRHGPRKVREVLEQSRRRAVGLEDTGRFLPPGAGQPVTVGRMGVELPDAADSALGSFAGGSRHDCRFSR